MLVNKVAVYTKAIVALLGGIATWGATAVTDGISANEWFGLLAVIATALGVFAFPNTPQGEGGEGGEGGDDGYAVPDLVVAILIFLVGVILTKLFWC
jgi:hypothetical protein